MDTWGRIVGLRRELIDQLEPLPIEQWDSPTLCPGWRVRDVVAHTILPKRFVSTGSLIMMARGGFSLNAAIHRDAVRRGSAPIPDLIAAFREAMDRRTLPPKRLAEHLLDDLFIHTQDIRRPCGLTWSYDPALLVQVASTLVADRGLGVQARISGLRLRATDVDWSHGEGEEVSGAAEALILAISGRKVVLGELSGPGCSVLSLRM